MSCGAPSPKLRPHSTRRTLGWRSVTVLLCTTSVAEPSTSACWKRPTGDSYCWARRAVSSIWAGVDFDEAVFQHVLASVDQRVELDPDDPSVDVALGRLRRECVDAKEALSSDTDVAVPVALPA